MLRSEETEMAQHRLTLADLVEMQARVTLARISEGTMDQDPLLKEILTGWANWILNQPKANNASNSPK